MIIRYLLYRKQGLYGTCCTLLRYLLYAFTVLAVHNFFQNIAQSLTSKALQV